MFPESVRLQGGGVKRGGDYLWSLGTEFVTLFQERILGHIEVETKKIY
jgi:hypothetical protein